MTPRSSVFQSDKSRPKMAFKMAGIHIPLFFLLFLAFLKESKAVIGGLSIQNRCTPPYNSMVSLQFRPGTGLVSFCSAIMLNETMLVTTGYCLAVVMPSISFPVNVVIGERDLQGTDYSEEAIPIDSYKVHRGYNNATNDNNIALIRLSRPARMSSCVRPVTRMIENSDPSACEDIDDSCIMVGWGPFQVTQTPTNSRLPRFAYLTVYGDFVSLLLRNDSTPAIGSLFAEGRSQRQQACYFDWGGLVACMRNSEYTLRGLVGFHNCANGGGSANSPITVTNVPYFQSWINNCMENWEFCQARTS